MRTPTLDRLRVKDCPFLLTAKRPPRLSKRMLNLPRWAAIALIAPLAASQNGSGDDCSPGWEAMFPPVGTAYTDPLTGCTGLYEVVLLDPEYIADRAEVSTVLVYHPIFPNGTCLPCTWSINHSVTQCDSYSITGHASFGGTFGSGVEVEAGVVFAMAKAQMQVSYTAEYTIGGGLEGQVCESWGWGSTIPGPPCTIIEFLGYKATQPTWATSLAIHELRVRFIDQCEVNGSLLVHQCSQLLRAELQGEQCPALGPGAGWRMVGNVEGCECPGDGDQGCLDQPKVFAVTTSPRVVTLKVSVDEWIRGVIAGCELGWVDGVIPDQERTVQVDLVAE